MIFYDEKESDLVSIERRENMGVIKIKKVE